MESEFVIVNKVPIRVDSWGGYLPSKVLYQTQQKPKELILMIPGNPGVTKFYENFLNHLHEKTKLPIWILSHGGHDKTNKKLPPLKKNKPLYNLQGQIEQKDKFIQTYLQDVTLYCVGHSIGCKMILDLLKKDRKTPEIEKCILLFPVVERMAETPNAAHLSFVIRYVLWLTLLASWVFTYLPKFLQIVLLRIYCLVARIPACNMPAMWRLVDPHVLSKVFFLADDCLKNVKELDSEVFEKHGKKLKMYYGATDGSAPLSFWKEISEKHKDVNIELCSRGFQHAFVLKQSKDVADVVSTWIKT